jgi:hypothetical protein
MEQLTKQQLKDLKILASFIVLYCSDHHDRKEGELTPIPEQLRSRSGSSAALCPECTALLEHGIRKRGLCPLEPKPSCRKCRIHCYSPEYRRRIREIMAYSGRKMLLKGRIDYLWHYYSG